MIADVLKEAIKRALEELSLSVPDDIHLEHPADISHGDYSTNIAMVLAKEVGKNPRELAEEIVKKVEEAKSSEAGSPDRPMKEVDLGKIEKVEVAGPGFINFYLTDDYFKSALEQILERGEDYGKSSLYKNKKILVEHTSPNLFKPFHIGHIMNNAIGESIVRLMRFSGADVSVVSYPSDVSLGIGKAVWALMDKGLESLDSLATVEEKLAFLGECYVHGTQKYDESEDTQKEIRSITNDIYTRNADSDAYKAYEKGKDINLKYFGAITKRLGSTFDDFIFESEAGKVGLEIVRQLVGGVFEESDGAIIYRGEQDGLHTRVFINKEGNPTYEGKDVGLVHLKFKQFSPNLSITVTDHEQSQYFDVVSHAYGKIEKQWQDAFVHLGHGRMTIKGAKMSSRLGNVPLAQDVLDLIIEVVREKAQEGEVLESEVIAIAALKYTILKNTLGKKVDFDPENATSVQGDSGPYVQYSTVRAKSVLEKSEQEASLESPEVPKELERKLVRFSEVVEIAIKEYAPQHIVSYITEIASLWNSYYTDHKIIGDEHEQYRLAVAQAVNTVLTNGLYLLGIKVPERM